MTDLAIAQPIKSSHTDIPIRIAYRVQHLVGRDDALARLLPRLPSETEVITDHPEDGVKRPMRGYLKCLENPPVNATHLCVIQDDALPCREAARRIGEAVGERPSDVVSLFVGGLPGRTRKDFWAAQAAGERWSSIWFREIHHVVALVWPIELVNDFLAWYKTARIPIPIPHNSDDAVVGYWARTQRRLFWATVPCLVEHPDDLPSTIHRDERRGDKGRRAIAFVDDIA